MELIKYFTGLTSWFGVAGAALFVFLLLFRTAAKDHFVARRIPAARAAGVLNVFMALVAAVTVVALTLAFLGAKEGHSLELKKRDQERYSRELARQQIAFRACVAAAEDAAQFSRGFKSPGSVRCPGGGCFMNGNCNRRETQISYTAPGEYFIESYELVPGAMNDGNVGAVREVARDDAKRLTAVQAQLWCDPPDRPGANGGWANAVLQGTLRMRNEPERKNQISESCKASNPLPAAPG